MVLGLGSVVPYTGDRVSWVPVVGEMVISSASVGGRSPEVPRLVQL